jgi:hypothetical protein
MPARKFVLAAALTLALAALFTPAASAQEWARKMFTTTSHDFGTVAAGAKAVFEFPVKNIYLEDIHIASVRASCSCTTPSVKTPTLKTYEKGAIVAQFNTDTFRAIARHAHRHDRRALLRRSAVAGAATSAATSFWTPKALGTVDQESLCKDRGRQLCWPQRLANHRRVE